jgi:hypothetical protein
MAVNRDSHDEQKGGIPIRFKKSSSGITVAANKGQSLWRGAAEEFGVWARATLAKQQDPEKMRILKERMRSLALSYVDTYSINRGKSWIDVDSLPKGITSVALLIPRKVVTDTVGDKLHFGQLAKQVGVEGVVVPRTFESAAEALGALTGPTNSSKSNIVFVKSSTGTAGKEVEPVAIHGLAAFLAARGGLKRGELIQEEVDGLALHQGRKFVIRSWFIVHGGALYVSHHAFAIVHGQKYDASTASRDVHVDHDHPDTAAGDLKVFTGEAGRAKWVAAIIAAAKLAGPMFESVVAATAKDNLLYHVFGVDVIPKATGDVMFVECNIFPHMGVERPKDSMAFSVLRLLYGVLQGADEGDDEMTKVWSLPPRLVPKWERGQRSEL